MHVADSDDPILRSVNSLREPTSEGVEASVRGFLPKVAYIWTQHMSCPIPAGPGFTLFPSGNILWCLLPPAHHSVRLIAFCLCRGSSVIGQQCSDMHGLSQPRPGRHTRLTAFLYFTILPWSWYLEEETFPYLVSIILQHFRLSIWSPSLPSRTVS